MEKPRKNNAFVWLVIGSFVVLVCLGAYLFVRYKNSIPLSFIPPSKEERAWQALEKSLDDEGSYTLAQKTAEEVEGKKIYRLIGWVKSVDLKKRLVMIGQPGEAFSESIFVPTYAQIRRASLDDNGQLMHEKKELTDLVVGETLVSILCTDDTYSQAEVVTIRAEELQKRYIK